MTTERKVVEGGVYVLNNGVALTAAVVHGEFHLMTEGGDWVCSVTADGLCTDDVQPNTAHRYSIDWPATEALQKPREIRVGDRVRLLEFSGESFIPEEMDSLVGTLQRVERVGYSPRYPDWALAADWWWPLSACELVTDEPAMERGFHGEKLEQAIRKSFAFAPNLNAPMLSRDVEGRPPLAWNTRTPFDHFPDMQFVVTRGGAS